MYVEGVSSELREAAEELKKYLEELHSFILTLPPATHQFDIDMEKRIIPLNRKFEELDKKYPKAARFIRMVAYRLIHR